MATTGKLAQRGILLVLLVAASACGKRTAEHQQQAVADNTPRQVQAAPPTDVASTPMTSQSLRITEVRLLSAVGNREGVAVLDAAQPIRAEVLSNGKGEGEPMHARLVDMGRGQQVAQQQSSWKPGDQRITVEFTDPGGKWPAGPYLLQINIGGSAAKEIDLRIE